MSRRARGNWIVVLSTTGVALLGLAAWLDMGPFGRLWPAARGLSSLAQFRQHEWRQDGQTLVLALSVQCQECLQSYGFYKELSKAAPGKFDMIAAFDDDPEEGQRRLRALDIAVQQVALVPKQALGIDATPALLLVDGRGFIKQRWIGLLNSLQRNEVASSLGIVLPTGEAPVQSAVVPIPIAPPGSIAPLGPGPSAPSISEKPSVSRLKTAFASPARAVIIDVRTRDAFKQLRIDGAINIPRDELVIRLLHEVDLAKSVFLFCDQCEECERVIPSVAQRVLCRLSLDVLRDLGALDVVVIDATLNELKAAGIFLISDSGK